MRRLAMFLQAPVALMVLYLDILTLAALRRRPALRPMPPRTRFAVLIPAHDEEFTLPRLLESLRAVQYPAELVDVYVVADNCTDRTAEVARDRGATALVRTDNERKGKGYALQWLLDTIAARRLSYDAYVILDADSTVSPNFLGVLNVHVLRGDRAIQVHYGVLNGGQSWPATLRYVALTLYNGLRPRGRDALGLSAGLRGNGMCFAAEVVERFGWNAFALAEDAEFHLQLVAQGIRVAYAPEAKVLAEMPVTLKQARSQNQRWERGRIQMLRAHGPRMMREAMAQRNPAGIDAVAELLVPPLSVLTAVAAVSYGATAAARLRGARTLAGAVLIGQLAYVFTGLRLERAGLRAYAALICAPLYIAWKVALFASALLRKHDNQWIRTERSQTHPRPQSAGPAEPQTGWSRKGLRNRRPLLVAGAMSHGRQH